MENLINLTIDNRPVAVAKGTTILDAAASVGIDIPALCHIDLKGTCVKNAPASCRICVVEVQGRRNLAPACATMVMEGMVVKTNSARVVRARKTVAELILSDHPNDCLTCPKCGDCELQKLVTRFNIREMPFKGEQSTRKKEHTVSITRNMDKCILCRRCESVCNEVQTVGVLGAVRRGFDTTIAPTFDRMFKDTDRCLGGRTPFEVFFQLYMLVGGMQSLPEECRVDLDGLLTPEEFAIMWECDNYERFREYYGYKTACSAIYDDMVCKADAHIAQGERGADLRFGHDHCLMTLLMIADIEDFDTQPADNDELCYWFYTFRSPMAANLQLVFYAPKGWPEKQQKVRGDKPQILVKLLLNGEESRFGKLETAQGPYYRWDDLKAYLQARTHLFVNYNN